MLPMIVQFREGGELRVHRVGDFLGAPRRYRVIEGGSFW